MKLLFQSDDYGLTDSTAEGILKAINFGIVRNTGLFVNMPSSARAAQRIKGIEGISLGIDINLVAGKPISDAKLVPSLVDSEGHFISSTARFKDNKIIGREGHTIIFENDPFNYEEALLETENQVKRFIELIGRKPDYFHGHSIGTPNTAKAAKVIAEKYGIVQSTAIHNNDKFFRIPCTWTPKPFPIEDQLKTNVEEELLKVLPLALKHEYAVFVCHCGFVEEDLFKESTYTIIRNKDLAAATSPRIIKWLKDNNVELINYSDAVKVL